MKELYLDTQSGRIPISKIMIKKYNLKKGTFSPFTHNRIVDKKGDFSKVLEAKKSFNNEIENEQIFSTAEALDIASGTDSQ